VFTELLQAGTLRPSDQPLGPRTSQDLEEAVGFYRGSFLEGFSLADSAPFEEWALLKREELQRQMLAALQQLISHTSAAARSRAPCHTHGTRWS
jgi:DNA-binding SARP family transcriptional activator